MGQRPRPD